MSVVLDGWLGDPTEPHVPMRSQKRIMQAVWEAGDRHHSIERLIGFQAVETPDGTNVSEVTIETVRVDGRPINEVTSIVYKNGRFRKATIRYADGQLVEHTLSGALVRLSNPIGA